MKNLTNTIHTIPENTQSLLDCKSCTRLVLSPDMEEYAAYSILMLITRCAIQTPTKKIYNTLVSLEKSKGETPPPSFQIRNVATFCIFPTSDPISAKSILK